MQERDNGGFSEWVEVVYQYGHFLTVDHFMLCNPTENIIYEKMCWMEN